MVAASHVLFAFAHMFCAHPSPGSSWAILQIFSAFVQIESRSPQLVVHVSVCAGRHFGSSIAGAIVIGCVVAPVIEELVIRGLLYRSLRSSWGIGVSLMVSAAVFTLDHVPVATVPILFAAACITLAFERSRSLYAAMLAHALINAAVLWRMFGHF